MFKLVVLFALMAIAAAAPAPGLLHAAPLAYSAAVVGSVPTSVSHQSSSVVHSAALAAPVVHAAYAAAPVVHAAYAAPVVHAAPAVAAYGYGLNGYGLHGYGYHGLY